MPWVDKVHDTIGVGVTQQGDEPAPPCLTRIFIMRGVTSKAITRTKAVLHAGGVSFPLKMKQTVFLAA